MTLIVISVDETTLPAHSPDEFEEWIRFSVGDTGAISIHNPLSDIDLDAVVKEIGF